MLLVTCPAVADGQASQLEFGGRDAGVGVGAWPEVTGPSDVAWMLQVHERCTHARPLLGSSRRLQASRHMTVELLGWIWCTQADTLRIQ